MPADLFSPTKLGSIALKNRIVMAPLTRNRAGKGNVPQPINAEYYAQRASAGLIITEATPISPTAHGYPATPGIHEPEQVEGWKLVTKAVHDKGGKIVLQLWHVGRISHPSLQPGNALPVAPSAIKPAGQAFTYEGLQDFVTPRALAIEELPGIVADYAQATRNALEAGFDGVEIHAANGYLLDQFLRDSTNRRTDEYGGSIENRTRLLLEVTQAVVDVAGADRVGVRISPLNPFNDISDSNPQALFNHVADSLSPFGLAYLHVVEGGMGGGDIPPFDFSALRRHFKGGYIANLGYDKAKGNAAIASGHADAVAYGSLYIANPDLVERFQQDAPLNTPDQATFYGGDAKGYTDYPTLQG
ncbi:MULTISPECIES: alkene reductase [Methylobacillus]|uniref:NADH:flavin oxidoreductase/NADH oxidase n=1 Tax=Methylobacillus flagellatus (strain ATCC 51484 / DSM 6875 / VKM B-1610 / KT) TaxID=265072 RepID=Q1H090_METFK|nr:MULTISPECIES: alkene reductase [Methylobacillus]ABE50097.1 NADH:flavin oxidoreductase/NADH oxidase [Methylobacillus flagellatus KT]MPS48671.1 alkene reductase [Methylobacillus sp.]